MLRRCVKEMFVLAESLLHDSVQNLGVVFTVTNNGNQEISELSAVGQAPVQPNGKNLGHPVLEASQAFVDRRATDNEVKCNNST